VSPLSTEEIDCLKSDAQVNFDLLKKTPIGVGDDNTFPIRLFEDIARSLIKIDDKLNRILDKLSEDDSNCPSEGIRVKKTSDISGSGICVLVHEALTLGQFVKISLNLPEGWPRHIETLGEVVRVTSPEADEANLYEVGIKFVNLSDEQRESIIAYTFQQQRDAIRQSKAEK
jgi:hypothetical protein